jgi:exodeoxyribonuclease V beta subunit
VPERLLCLIGDPKQAIYSFRGADIFAYIRAVRDIDSRFTLRENYRSRPDLIRAVNAVFSRRREPFVFKEISFEPARPAARGNELLLIDQAEARPFQLWMAKRREEGAMASISKEEARRLILSWLQEEICRLLRLGRQGRARLAERDLSPGDLAVLVRTNREARLVQSALAAVGVASVLNSSESLFASREAVEVHLLLQALVERNNRRRIRAALATRLLGVEAGCLDLFGNEDEELGQWFDRFGEYHQLWVRQGFVVMFSALLLNEGVRERLLALPGGERSLTNVLHLQEVLHRVAEERRLGVTGLGQYLGEKITQAEENPAEELQLRLASDSALVQIVTIHKSKGLQYPVVFCPFCWEGSRLLLLESRSGKERRPGYLFHEEDGHCQPVLDLGSSESAGNRTLALREEAAENLRLLYVALTRASHCCYLAWGSFSGAGTSALAYLLHSRESAQASAPLWGIDLLLGRSDADLEAELGEVVARSGGSIDLSWRRSARSVTPLEPELKKFQAIPRLFTGEIRSDWRIESFSSLHRAASPEIRAIGGDPGGEGRAQADEAGFFAEIMNFPAGPGPGTFLHELLERLDFCEAQPTARRAIVRQQLAASGYDRRWEKGLEIMLDDLLHTSLSPEDNRLMLAAISREARLNELEFYFPLESVNQATLRQLLADRGWSLEPGAKLRGMMKGYIDLVFHYQERYYIVDWKSNHLGWEVADYAENRLPEAMFREGYTLQYLIYTVALHRYLSCRLPGYSYEKHFGGVFYLFLRGVRQTAGPAYGIFRDKPEPWLIQNLARCFAGES